MKNFPRRLSRRGPGRVSYDPTEPLPPEVPTDTEREAALDAKWAVYEKLEKQAAGDCTPESFVDRWTADLIGRVDETGQVTSDGRTVWVTSRAGYTVGRFSAHGVDIHTALSDGCIDCTHTRPTMSDWHRFQNGMREHHRIEVGGEHCPDFLDTDRGAYDADERGLMSEERENVVRGDA